MRVVSISLGGLAIVEGLREMKADEFIRRLKELMEQHEDTRFVFFMGAGCSISSGIPDAKTLVKTWLRKLKKLRTGDEDNLESWINQEYPGYSEDRCSRFYGRVIEDLFLTPDERQREIERLTEGKDPAFGYAVLAQLVTHAMYGHHCNVVLTVNFDDLIGDALYLYTNRKPLIVAHDSLVGFVKITRSRPLVIKIHGDARLEPKNTTQETEEPTEAVKKAIKDLLRETGLIFIGYGGNDGTIAEILDELPSEALPLGIYWVSAEVPESRIGVWLKDRRATWVKHQDFDELMLLMRNEFNLVHPRRERFDNLLKTYFKTFTRLKKRIEIQPKVEETKPLADALEKATEELEPWRQAILEASDCEQNEPDEAEKIYAEALDRFPSAVDLINSYGSFLIRIRLDPERAEQHFKRALEISPDNSYVLSSYGCLLICCLNDIVRGGELLRKAVLIDPYDPWLLSNYGAFLWNIKGDFTGGEEYLKKAVELAPRDLVSTTNLAGLLLARGDSEGFQLLKRSIELCRESKDRPELLLQSMFYSYSHSQSTNVQKESLKELRTLLRAGKRNVMFMARSNIEKAIADGHPYPELLMKLEKVIRAEIGIQELDDFEPWREIL